MYYLWQHEKIGVFRAVQKLQELFKAGTVRLSGGRARSLSISLIAGMCCAIPSDDRLSAYKRIFGYGGAPVPTGSRANTDFHKLFSHFVHQVTLFWRDKRISDVIRERAYDPSFGSIAIVRRAGLDLRNNLKWLSFGHLNVLRVEVMQLLEEAFKILDLRRRQTLVWRRQCLGRGGRSFDSLLQRAAGHFAAAAHGSYGTRSPALAGATAYFAVHAGTIRDPVARNCRTVGRMADQRAGHGSQQTDGVASRVAMGPVSTDTDSIERPAEGRCFTTASSSKGI